MKGTDIRRVFGTNADTWDAPKVVCDNLLSSKHPQEVAEICGYSVM